MKVKIEIEATNAAFEDDAGELSRILHALARRIEHGGPGCYAGSDLPLYDINGNRVGFARFDEED